MRTVVVVAAAGDGCSRGPPVSWPPCPVSRHLQYDTNLLHLYGI